MTALFDGIACIIDDTIEYMSALDIQHDVGLAPPKVIVFILTDGLENSSGTTATWATDIAKRDIAQSELSHKCPVKQYMSLTSLLDPGTLCE